MAAVRSIDKYLLLSKLATARVSLIRAYLLHVIWFALMCVLVGVHWSDDGLKLSVLLTLVTVPPVLFFTVRVHELCRAIDPHARTVGLVPVLITTLVLSPFESGLILPAKNLLAAHRILRAHQNPTGAPASSANGPERPSTRQVVRSIAQSA